VNTEQLADSLVDWLRSEVDAAGCKGVVFGLSGGIDSATVAVLARRAFRDQHLAVIMPIGSDPRDREDALLIIEKFKVKRPGLRRLRPCPRGGSRRCKAGPAAQ